MKTLSQIAKELGYSQSTVSRVANGKGQLSEKTRQHILDALHRHGYQANLTARDLARKRWHGAGMPHKQRSFAFISRSKNGLSSLTWKFCEDWCLQKGHSLMCCSVSSQSDLRQQARILRSRGIEGIVIGPGIEASWLEDPIFQEILSVSCSTEVSASHIYRIREDAFQRVLSAVEQCHRRGYRRLGFALIEPPTLTEADLRRRGALQILDHLFPHCHFAPPFVLPLSDSDSMSEPQRVSDLRTWIMSHRLDAVVGLNPLILYFLGQTGIRTPEECGFCALNIGQTEASSDIAGFKRNRERLAHMAFRLLEYLLPEKKFISDERLTMLIGSEWTEGRTLPVRD